MQHYEPHLKPLARNLRCNMTDAEQHLWKHLRNKQIHGVTFNRQKPLAGYIADFYCAAAKLVVELDGSQHFEAEKSVQDDARTHALEALGLELLRFDNHQVLMETENVVGKIADVVKRKIPPNPPSAKGGTYTQSLSGGKQPVIAYLGIGSNLDDPLAHVTRAIDELAHCEGVCVQRVSRWYGSKAVGPGAQPDYVNGVIEIDTTLEPLALLHTLQAIEQAHGRTRTTRWGARTLDLDILLYGEAVVDQPDLLIPHPRIVERAFVLKPLADLCPARAIPCPNSGKNATIAHLLERLPAQDVWPLETTR